MRYCIITILIFLSAIVKSQTYSKLIPDSEILSFINNDILNDSIKTAKLIDRKIIDLPLEIFYYKDSSDFENKNRNPMFLFRNHVINGHQNSNHLDTLFSRQDIDFFYQQIASRKIIALWKKPFNNSKLAKKITLDSNHLAKQTVFSYSLPLFSADKKKAIIIKSFYCGLLCGGSATYIYQKDNNDNWQLLKVINQLGE